MRRDAHPRALQRANLVSVLGTLAFNTWVSVRPLNGVTTGEVSAAYPTLITPPGWVFSIWGVIYAALLVFAFYQARPAQRSRPSPWTCASTIACCTTTRVGAASRP